MAKTEAEQAYDFCETDLGLPVLRPIRMNWLETGAPADEIEITPAMIEAGEGVLLSELGGAVQTNWEPCDLAVAVFRAMLAGR